jgi:protein-tyrosine kinase
VIDMSAFDNTRHPFMDPASAAGGAPSTPPWLAPTSTYATQDPAAAASEVTLDAEHLEAARIIGHDVTDPRAKSYDILRTHVLQAMDLHDWHLLGITSPTKGCGKTLTSINLAFSIGRQMERSVLLIDMDFRKPQLAGRLGVRSDVGFLDVLDGRVPASEAMFRVRAGRHSVLVLPTDATEISAELMASRAMQTFIQELRRDFRSCIVILDLPPMLVSDDVAVLLPQVDCALLVAAVGTTTVPEIEECSRHLQSTNLLRIVVNKVPESKKMYY